MLKEQAEKFARELTELFPLNEFYARKLHETYFISVHDGSGKFDKLMTKQSVLTYIKENF